MCLMALSMGLQDIAATWAHLSLELTEYKGTWKLQTTEEIFRALEDHSVSLSSMKASRYFATFQQEVTQWEQTLARVSEAVEALLLVCVFVVVSGSHH
jgi:dynein heavy chain